MPHVVQRGAGPSVSLAEKAAGDLVYRDDVDESWNWESSDTYCFADLAFAVFPEKTSINYQRLSDPWE